MASGRSVLWIAVSAVLAPGAAHAQQFVNGDFETGSLDPWIIRTTPNGRTLSQGVAPYEIKGPGTGVSNAARFQVGQILFTPGEQEGIEVLQELQLNEGVEYTVSFDWAADRLTTTAFNSDLGTFGIVVDGALMDSVWAGEWQANQSAPAVGSLAARFTPSRTGTHTVGVRITRRFQPPTEMYQYLDNIRIDGGGCYPDCDGNETLDFFDFLCFQNAFLAQDPYADCDENGVLDFFDFLCFQNAFLAGCP
jgi:hypothetical protein